MGSPQRVVGCTLTRRLAHVCMHAYMYACTIQEVLTRVTRLEEMGKITGVVDDRGKFIYIADEEMDKVPRPHAGSPTSNVQRSLTLPTPSPHTLHPTPYR